MSIFTELLDNINYIDPETIFTLHHTRWAHIPYKYYLQYTNKRGIAQIDIEDERYDLIKCKFGELIGWDYTEKIKVGRILGWFVITDLSLPYEELCV